MISELNRIELLEKSKRYWKEKLSGELSNIKILSDFSNGKDYKAAKFEINFSDSINEKLIQISKNNDLSLYVILLTAYKVLLNKYTNEGDIIVASPIYGQEAENYNKWVLTRDYIREDSTFKELLLEVRNTVSKAYQNQQLPFRKLLDLSDNKNLSLFRYIILLKNIHNERFFYEIVDEYENDICFSIEKDDALVKVSIIYNERLFAIETIQALFNHYSCILDSALNNININMNDIELISEDEKLLLDGFNATQNYYSKDKTLDQLFEEQVGINANNKAIILGQEYLTYSELNEKANQLARSLISIGVVKETIVGILLENSIDVAISILGVLKAGGAYLPIDKNYPDDRINFIMEDSEIKFLIHDDNSKFHGKILNDVNIKDESIWREDASNLNVKRDPSGLAYIIYTSGTTHRPKGVLIEHKGVVNTIEARKHKYNINENNVMLQLFSYSFDGFVTSFFTPLLSGAKLVLLNSIDIKDILKIKEAIVNNQVTNFISVPAIFSTILDVLTNQEIASLKVVTLAGDMVSSNIIEKAANKGIEIVNEYGITEASVMSTLYFNQEKDPKIKIGKPSWNTKIYILNKHNKIQPIGLPGEICISGVGVAREYLKRVDLTQQKFVDNLLGNGERIYRSGDFGRWLPNGNLELLGRIDNQVKIRGFRIELEEIQSQLLRYTEIKDALVIPYEINSDKFLCAYTVSDNNISTQEINDYLSEKLPEYMIPTTFIQIDEIPYTSNGKIDRKRLPKPKDNYDNEVKYEEPVTKTERDLAEIWKDVLQIEQVGLNDKFFDLGGHSLKATILAAKIHKTFNIEISLLEIFKMKTLKDMSKYIDNSRKNTFYSIDKVEDREYYALSSSQKRIFVLHKFDENSISYNVIELLKVDGLLDRDRVEECFKKLIKRHEVLRTGIEIIDGVPMQKVYKNIDFNVDVVKIQEDELDAELSNFNKPFNLKNPPLINVRIISLEDQKNIIAINIHHIISDGASIGILIKEFLQLYKQEKLEENRLQYRDYAYWQSNQANSPNVTKQKEYWIDLFKEGVPTLEFPTDFARPAVQSFEGESIKCQIDKKLSKKLYDISTKNDATLYMTLLTAYKILLYKYTGQEEIVVGSPIAGRNHYDLNPILGVFINTLALKSEPLGNKSFNQFLSEVKEACLNAYDNQDYQFEDMVNELSLNRDISRNAVFDAMFVLQNNDIDFIEEIQIDKLKVSRLEADNKTAKCDISLGAVEINDTIRFELNYCRDLFKKETMNSALEHFINILKQITENTNIKLDEIHVLSKVERERIIYEFNNTSEINKGTRIVHELFKMQANCLPDKIALELGDKVMNYKELDEKSNQLARLLRSKNVGRDQIVGIMLPRSLDMMVGILAVLKAGAAYLPIDWTIPSSRIKYMIDDSKVSTLLSENDILSKNSYLDFNGEVIDITNADLSDFDVRELENLNCEDDLAYVIYTSGSTGNPKGVMIEHKAVCNFISGITKEVSFTEEKTILAITTISFDIFVLETIVPLVKGLKVIIADESQVNDPKLLKQLITNKKISMIQVTPSRLKLLIDYDNDYSWLYDIKELMVGGEAFPENVMDIIQEYSYAKVYNLYGPTETTIWSTVKEIISESDINIGKPILNTQIYILDENFSVQPIGVVGELCIAGDGLARGYINNDDLTKEKFITKVIGSEKRIYKTGDLAKWLPDGNIKFLGRRDYQVKLRGYRIELKEVECKLKELSYINDAVVIIKGEESKYICVYIISENKITVSDIRNDLREVLPEYMIPSAFVQLEKFPLNSSGKIDMKFLLEYEDAKISLGIDYVEPEKEIEKVISSIWSEVLGVSKIGLNDNFFELGGNSISLIKVNTSINKSLNCNIEVIQMFKYTTVKSLTRYIEQLENEAILSKEYDSDRIALINSGKDRLKKIKNKRMR